MVDDFIDRKHGRAPVRYPHAALEPLLRPTYGVILYQEQVMQIAQVLAGYTLGAADLLRRAMGKKKPEEMAKQRAIFIAGAEARGVGPALAASIFDLMEKFAGYGFNKSHSAAYALIAYQTAWLKARHPEAFMAAVLTADMDHTDKVVALVDECRRMGLALLPPDVNISGYGFAVDGPGAIRYGLGAVKGAGRGAIEALTAEREAHGPYRDLYDLCMRVDARKANRRVLEALVRAGALDPLAQGAGAAGRSGLIASLGAAMQAAEQTRTGRSTGQEDLFGAMLAAPVPRLARSPHAVAAPGWTDEQRLAGEYETLGLYLSGHPIERYEPELPGLVSCRLSELKPGARRVAGLVVGIRQNNSRRGRMAIVVLDDRTTRIEAVVYPEVLKRSGDAIAKGRVVIAEGNCSIDEFGGGYSLIAERVLGITEARETYARELIVRVDASRMANGFVEALRSVLNPFRSGTCRVLIEYRSERASTLLRLSEAWCVRPADELLEGLGALVGPDGVRIDYATPVA
jgi:DNA polymerase-3 subunit alpha